MKKSLNLVLSTCLSLLVCMLIFTACNNVNETQTPDTTTDPEIDNHVHAFGDWSTVKDATCTENGEKERVCACGEKETQTVDALGHTEVVDQAVTPTCTTDGKTEGKHCSVCNQILVEQAVLKKGDHTFSEWIVEKEATKTENGIKRQNCTVCGESVSETLYAIGSQGLAYRVNDNKSTCSITDIGTCTDTEVYVPAYIDGYKVTAVYLGFCDNFTSVIIADGITEIKDSAFYGCDNLINVVIPDSVVKIGKDAFYKCVNIKNINIPNSTQIIGANAFSYMTSLESITVESENLNYKSVDGNLYTKDGTVFIQYAVGKKTTSFKIPNGVTEIASLAFFAAESLTNIVLPEDLTAIGHNAFAYCMKLSEIVIPDGVDTISAYAFRSCSKLRNITIPESVIYIEEGAFRDCENLTGITIPSGLTTIDKYMFYGCSKLKSVIIPEGITSIYEYAFVNCSSIATIAIPSTVTYIDPSAFQSNSFTKIDVSENNDQYASIDKDLYTKDGSTLILCANGKPDTSITIRDGVTCIGAYALAGNIIVKSITIPSSVKTIESRVFSYCYATELNYIGTMAQWEAIDKVSDWDSGFGTWEYGSGYTYTINCLDGNITK